MSDLCTQSKNDQQRRPGQIARLSNTEWFVLSSNGSWLENNAIKLSVTGTVCSWSGNHGELGGLDLSWVGAIGSNGPND